MASALITGARGTVGTALSRHLIANNYNVIRWDRDQVPVNDAAAITAFMASAHPDVVFHLASASQPTGLENEDWIVNVEWTANLAQITAEQGIRFVFTSSVMVYSDNASGPFMVDSLPDQTSGYGYEKHQAEQRTLGSNPGAIVARLGWQIGDAAGSNNMLTFFEEQMAANGEVRASRKWYPACSFLPDTAAALLNLVNEPGGLYLIDSNTEWTFYEIASALNTAHGAIWKIVPTDDFVFDQRMVDRRVPIPPLSDRLPSLA